MNRCKRCDNPNLKVNTLYLYHDVYECDSCDTLSYKRIEDCCRSPFEIVVKDDHGYPQYFIRKQCKNCGGCLNMNKPLSSKTYGDAIRGQFDRFRLDNWKTVIREEGDMLRGFKRTSDVTNSNRYKYLTYLLSDEWKAKRLIVLERDNCLCQECKLAPATDIHHLTYIHLFNEPIEDLLALCKACHTRRHSFSPQSQLSAI